MTAATSKLVEAIRVLDQQATVGPWIKSPKAADAIIAPAQPPPTNYPECVRDYGGYVVGESLQSHDLQFVCAARSLLVAAADLIERQAETIQTGFRSNDAQRARAEHAEAEVERLRAERDRLAALVWRFIGEADAITLQEWAERFEAALDPSSAHCDPLAELLREAVETDGAHHKQWLLEEIAARLGVELPEHDAGVAP